MRETPSGFLFLGLSLFVVWESLRMGTGTMKEPGAGFLSLWTGVALAVFALVLIIRGWKTDKGAPRVKHSRVTLAALVALFVYSMIVDVTGFVVATFFLVLVLFYLAQRRPWWILVGMSAVVTAVAYVVFGMILKVYFPAGILGI